MNYITATELLNSLGKSELMITVTGKLDQRLDADLLARVITGGDTAAFSAEDITVAVEAVALINNAISSASKLITPYIYERWGDTLTSDIISDSPLPLICIKLTRYELSINPSELSTNDKKDALVQLRDIAKGLVTLGSKDPQAVSSSGSVRVARSASSSLTNGFGR
jgi:phage gp36-like protein